MKYTVFLLWLTLTSLSDLTSGRDKIDEFEIVDYFDLFYVANRLVEIEDNGEIIADVISETEGLEYIIQDKIKELSVGGSSAQLLFYSNGRNSRYLWDLSNLSNLSNLFQDYPAQKPSERLDRKEIRNVLLNNSLQVRQKIRLHFFLTDTDFTQMMSNGAKLINWLPQTTNYLCSNGKARLELYFYFTNATGTMDENFKKSIRNSLDFCKNCSQIKAQGDIKLYYTDI